TGDLRVTNALLYQLSYSGSNFSFTGCKFTAFFEITKRKETFFEKKIRTEPFTLKTSHFL
ncbi:hypothetical protein, partial [uncultured Bacteroides sp.]|uniref:hypothetical protein n=1 Tax=uncultured Bacteroides sp. TaxID=162156 RepID=UPI0026202FA8